MTMKNILIDTGVWTLMFTKPLPNAIKKLKNDLINKKIRGFVIKPTILETSKHLTKIYGIQSVLPMILSSIHTLNLGIVEITEKWYIQAGILQYQYKNTLSACDSLLITTAKAQSYILFTTDKSAVDELTKKDKKLLKFEKVAF